MADPYIGEIRNFGFNYAPYQWASCNGATMLIQQNSALYALIGTQFGGDGRTNFMLPNLAARAPGGQGQGPGLTPRSTGEDFGAQQVSLVVDEIAPHNHGGIQVWEGGSGTRTPGPTPEAALSAADIAIVFANPSDTVIMSPMAIGVSGGAIPHENRQPALSTNFCIALSGVFPSFP